MAFHLTSSHYIKDVVATRKPSLKHLSDSATALVRSISLALCCVLTTGIAEAAPSVFIFESASKKVTVKAGDTLQQIAKREYGTVGYWRHIAEYNDLNPVAELQVGQMLQLPVLNKRLREYAEVLFVKGKVNLKPADPATPAAELTKEDRIYIDDIITTGKSGFASLIYTTGTVVNVLPDSSVSLQKLRCLEDDDVCLMNIDISRGGISSDVKKSDQPTKFTIDTPYATAAVRGTIFDFDAGSDGVVVGVTEGAVDIVSQGKTSPLPIGFGSVTDPTKGTGPAIELTGPTTYRGIAPRFAEGDKISWWTVPDSESYIVSLASDASAREIVVQKRQGELFYELGNEMQPGEYFVNVRPVDKNGIKGFGISQRINVVGIDESIDGMPVEAVREGSDMTVTVVEQPEAAAGYEFQLSSTESFDDVVSVDVGRSGSAVFRALDSDVYVRARGLTVEGTVSEFGPALLVN